MRRKRKKVEGGEKGRKRRVGCRGRGRKQREKRKKAEEEKGKKETWPVLGIHRHSLESQAGDGEIVQDANGEINAGYFLVDTITAYLWSAAWYTDACVCCVAVTSGCFAHLSTQIFATFLE